MLLPTLALRNLGRNARRSLITGLALALGTALCIAYYGLADGMNAALVHSLTRYDLGHVQLHSADWTKHRALDATILHPDEVLSRIRREPLVRGAAVRTYAAALVGSDKHSTGVELVGIDPIHERRVTELDRRIVSGRFLPAEPTPWPTARELTAEERIEDARLTEAQTEQAESEIDDRAGSKQDARTAPSEAAPAVGAAEARRLSALLSPRPERPLPVVLGVSLAHVLSVSVGDPLYLSTRGVDGSVEGVRAAVVGIYETGTTAYDRTRIYLHVADLQRLTHLADRVHEIALAVRSPSRAAAVAARLRQSQPLHSLDVRSWDELRPDILRMLDLNRATSALLALVVLFVASLGVINTMLMAVLERTRELGMLKAIGMPAVDVFGLIVVETVFLAVCAAAAGTVFGLVLDLYLVRHGIDLRGFTRGFSLGGIGIEPMLHGAITAGGVLGPVAILTAVCVAAAVYPAWRAARLDPAVGMRET